MINLSTSLLGLTAATYSHLGRSCAKADTRHPFCRVKDSSCLAKTNLCLPNCMTIEKSKFIFQSFAVGKEHLSLVTLVTRSIRIGWPSATGFSLFIVDMCLTLGNDRIDSHTFGAWTGLKHEVASIYGMRPMQKASQAHQPKDSQHNVALQMND